MASRKQVPQPRVCTQCGTTFYTARKGRLHCSGACNTRAWRARQPAAAQATRASKLQVAPQALRAPAGGMPSADTLLERAPEAAVPPVAKPLGFGSTVAATVVGNFISDTLTGWWAPKGEGTSLPPSGWPTWPPAELLATTGPPLQLRDAHWPAPLLLTPVTYREHRFYLCFDEGLTVVLYQLATGEWQPVRTPAELDRLTVQPPQRLDRLRALQTQHAGAALAQAPPSAPLQAPAVADPH